MAVLADLGPISPELVLVCPELREALLEEQRAREAAPRLSLVPAPTPAPRPRLELVPVAAEPALALADPPAHPSLALAATAYALQRLAVVVTQSVVIVTIVAVVIVALQLASV